jgi:hypothetical protein
MNTEKPINTESPGFSFADTKPIRLIGERLERRNRAFAAAGAQKVKESAGADRRRAIAS